MRRIDAVYLERPVAEARILSSMLKRESFLGGTGM
jgi:hypothetical protein